MQPLRRTAVTSSRRLRPSRTQQSRRYAHDGHHTQVDTHHRGPSNENLGPGFYIAIAAIPLSFALYKFSAQGTDQQPALTRFIASYGDWKQKFQERNDLHTQMIERAAADKNLFLNSRGSKHVDLRFPEVFNTGSPWNVPAGQGGANLDMLIAKYEEEAYTENEKKLEALRNGTVRREQPVVNPVPKTTPAVVSA